MGYGLGDFGSNIVWGMSINFLLYFYTDVFGISAAAAGTLLLVARVIDAMLDPVMGLITERVTTRWGKFRPYLLFGTPVLGILLILTFTTPNVRLQRQIAVRLRHVHLAGRVVYGSQPAVRSAGFRDDAGAR